MSDVVVPDAATAWNLFTGALGLAMLPVDPMTGLSLLTGTVAVRMAQEGKKAVTVERDESHAGRIQTEHRMQMRESAAAMETAASRQTEKLLMDRCDALERRVASLESCIHTTARFLRTALASAALGALAYRAYHAWCARRAAVAPPASGDAPGGPPGAACAPPRPSSIESPRKPAAGESDSDCDWDPVDAGQDAPPGFDKGDHVIAQYLDGSWYKATVESRGARDTYVLKWSDGTYSDGVPAEQLRLSKE